MGRWVAVSGIETQLWAVSATLGVALCITFYVIVRLINEIVYVRDALQDSEDIEHAKCMAAVMQFVGDEFAAQVLDTAATDYDSVENEMDLSRISRLRYTEGGESVPAIWLRERAERLRTLGAEARERVRA